MPTPLFPLSLLPAATTTTSPPLLPPGYTFRPLQNNDFHNGHLEPLRDLAFIGTITEEAWRQRFEYMASCPETYFVVVIVAEETGRIVGTGTLVVERKFLFELGIQGHIEDIAISKQHQGKHLGLSLLTALSHIAKEVGCYKTILDCSGKNVGFYEKCGYEQGGCEMQHYLDERAREHRV